MGMDLYLFENKDREIEIAYVRESYGGNRIYAREIVPETYVVDLALKQDDYFRQIPAKLMRQRFEELKEEMPEYKMLAYEEFIKKAEEFEEKHNKMPYVYNSY